jgi:hypothetical protein
VTLLAEALKLNSTLETLIVACHASARLDMG